MEARRRRFEKRFRCAGEESAGSNTDSVKPLCVNRQDRFFVRLRQILARQKLIDFFSTGLGAKAFMWEVGGKQKRLIARFFYGETKAAVVAVKTDKNPAGFDVSSKIFAGGHLGLRRSSSTAACGS